MMDRRKHHVEYASENMNKAFVKESDGDDDDELALPAIPAGTKNYMTPAGHKRIKDELLHLIDRKWYASCIGPLPTATVRKTAITSTANAACAKSIAASAS
jgi:hypothetical protein